MYANERFLSSADKLFGVLVLIKMFYAFSSVVTMREQVWVQNV